MLNTEKPNIVASITSNLEEKTVEAERKGANAVEVRLDLYNGNIQDLEDLELPVIVTNRPDWEGGEHTGTEGERIRELKEAIEHADAVDIELEAKEQHQEIIEEAKKQDATVIVSSHDFQKTPDVEKMKRNLEKSGEIGDIAKLAVKAENKEDSIKLLKATEEVEEEVSTMAMGSPGSYTRIVSSVHGSKITYASLGEKTAPGQLSVEEVKQAFEKLNLR